jgi:putative ABC transport system substrate-binding protein
MRCCNLLVLGVVLAAAGSIAEGNAAQPQRLVRIGALTDSWGPTPAIVGLRDGLKELGYREDRDFVIGVRFTQGNSAELPAAARDLVKRGLDLMVTAGGDNAAKAAQMATTQIPIVFMGASDPVGWGLVKSFARPGGNLTGVADLESDLVQKRLEIFRELVPGMKRVLAVYDGTNAEAVQRLALHREAARRLGLTLVERPVRTEDEARTAIAGASKGQVDGMFSPRQLSLNIPGLIVEIAPRRSIPTMFYEVFFVERDGLASYSASAYELGRQAARMVDKILKGRKPTDIPVEQPTKFELAVNLKAAKALGISIPESLLHRATRLIE